MLPFDIIYYKQIILKHIKRSENRREHLIQEFAVPAAFLNDAVTL